MDDVITAVPLERDRETVRPDVPRSEAPIVQHEEQPDLESHDRLYRKFVNLAKLGAFAAPLLLAFVVYWYR